MTERKHSEIVSCMIDWFERPGSWTQHTLWRDKDGKIFGIIPEEKERVTQCCFMGAAILCYHDTRKIDRIMNIATSIIGSSVTAFNDRPKTTQEDILDLCHKVKKALEEKGL